MYKDEDIEYVNQLRIDLANSDEYAFGRRMSIFKRMLKKGKIVALIKIIVRHKKVADLSRVPKKYNQIVKQEGLYRGKKIVVYTCVTGGYDKIFEPIFSREGLDYVMFVDEGENNRSGTKWKVVELPNAVLTNYPNDKKNRYVKFHPHELFNGKYDYAIYIDGNIQVVSDVRKMVDCIDGKTGLAMHRHRERNDVYDEYRVCKLIKKGHLKQMKMQLEKYKKDGFPKRFGMTEANVIAIDLKSNISRKIMDDWWNEYESSNSGRDQIALPYVLWKNNFSVDDVATLGSNVYANNKLIIKRHTAAEELV